jgi:hypothetical protein
MKDCEEEKKILAIRKKERQKELEAINTKAPVELEQVKIAKDYLNKYSDSKMKDCDQKKKILFIWNQELQNELEAIKTNVPLQNLQLVGPRSQPRQGRQCGIDTADDGKMSLHNFQFIKRLGEGGFGTVVITKGNLLGGYEKRYAKKAINKRDITSSNICEIMAEEALMLTSHHPFNKTLYSCFQNKYRIFFVME